MVFIVFSEEILTLLFGSDYGSGAGALKVLSAFFVLATYYFFSGKLLNINEDTNFVFYSNIGMAVGNLVLSVFLVQWWGVLGAGIASGFSYFLVRFISHVRSKRFIDIPADRWFEGSLILITGGSMAIAYYLSRGVTALLDIPLVVYLVLAGCLYTGLFLLGVHLFDLAGEEEKAILSVFEEELGIDLSWLKQLL
jgi:O-antigen/teichoic acid export membrane protein